MKFFGEKNNVVAFREKIRKLNVEVKEEQKFNLSDLSSWENFLNQIAIYSEKYGLEIKGFFNLQVIDSSVFDRIKIMIIDNELGVMMIAHFVTNKNPEVKFIQGLFEMISSV